MSLFKIHGTTNPQAKDLPNYVQPIANFKERLFHIETQQYVMHKLMEAVHEYYTLPRESFIKPKQCTYIDPQVEQLLQKKQKRGKTTPMYVSHPLQNLDILFNQDKICQEIGEKSNRKYR